MIEAQATVVAVEPGYAWVETARRTACGECSMQKNCGTAAMGHLFGKRTSRIRAVDGIGVSPGDRVVVGFDEQSLLRASSAVYLIPLAGLLAGGLVAGQLAAAPGEAAVIVGATAGLVAGFALLHLLSRWLTARREFQSVIVRLGEGTALHAPPPGSGEAGCRH